MTLTRKPETGRRDLQANDKQVPSYERYFDLDDGPAPPKSNPQGLRYYDEYRRSNSNNQNDEATSGTKQPAKFIPQAKILKMTPGDAGPVWRRQEPVFEDTTRQVEQTTQMHISPQKRMQVPTFQNPESFRDVEEVPKKKLIKVSHIDHFFKNKESINKEFYRTPSQQDSATKISNGGFGVTGKGQGRPDPVRETVGGMWEDQAQGDFTEEDLKKLERKALPRDYMGSDDNLKFY